MENRWGKKWKQWGNGEKFTFLGSKITVDGDYSHEIKRRLLRGRKAMTNMDSILKSRDITVLTKVHIVKAMVFPVAMYGRDSWTIKNCQRIDAFKLWCWRRHESFLESKEIKPVNPKGNQAWKFTGKTDAKAKAPVLWPPDVKSQLTGKDSDAGKYWRKEEKRTREDEMVGWHHQPNGQEQTLRDSEGRRSLVCCSPWGCKVRNDWVNNNDRQL